jgi:hypothetical protein
MTDIIAKQGLDMAVHAAAPLDCAITS